MSRLRTGTPVPELCLPGLDGRPFDLKTLRGRRFLLSFHRFASCPFCNLHIHRLVEAYPRFGPGFEVVAVFDSPLDNLRRHAGRHRAPFPILADAENVHYRRFAVERSLAGTIRGWFLRLPELLNAMFLKGYFPTGFQGALTTMPLDILVAEDGTIAHPHYGRDEGDHLSIDQLIAFAHGDHRAQTATPSA